MPGAELEDDAWYQAVAAIDAGDVQRLQLLLAAHPRLGTDRLDGSPEWLRLQLGDAADGSRTPSNGINERAELVLSQQVLARLSSPRLSG
jgi:hypothetical protein